MNPEDQKIGALNSRQIYRAVFRVQNETHQAIQQMIEYASKIGLSYPTLAVRKEKLASFFEGIKQDIFLLDKDNSNKMIKFGDFRSRSIEELKTISEKANSEKKRWMDFSHQLLCDFDEILELCEQEQNRSSRLFKLRKGENPAKVFEVFAAKRKIDISARSKNKISLPRRRNGKNSNSDFKPTQSASKSSRHSPLSLDSIQKLKYDITEGLRLAENNIEKLHIAIRYSAWDLFELTLFQGGLIELHLSSIFSRIILDLIFEALEKIKDDLEKLKEYEEGSLKDDYPPMSWTRSLILILELVAAKELHSMKMAAADKVSQKKTKFISELFNLLIKHDNPKNKFAITFISSGIPLDLRIIKNSKNGDISTKVFTKRFLKNYQEFSDDDASIEDSDFDSVLGEIFFKAAHAFECIKGARDFKFAHPLQRDAEGNPLIHLVCKHKDNQTLRQILSSSFLPKISYSFSKKLKLDKDVEITHLKLREHEISLYPLFCRNQNGRTPLDIITLDILSLRETLELLKISLQGTKGHVNYQKNWDEQDAVRSEILMKEYKKAIILNKLQPYVDRFVFKLMTCIAPKSLSFEILWDIMQLIDLFPGARGLTFETVIVDNIQNPNLMAMVKRAFNSKAIRNAVERALLQEYHFQKYFINYFKTLSYNSAALTSFPSNGNFFSPYLENYRSFHLNLVNFHVLAQDYEKESITKQDLLRSTTLLFSAQKSTLEETESLPENAANQPSLKKLRLALKNIYSSADIASILQPEVFPSSLSSSNASPDDLHSPVQYDFLRDDNESLEGDMNTIADFMQIEEEEEMQNKNKDSQVLKRVFS